MVPSGNIKDDMQAPPLDTSNSPYEWASYYHSLGLCVIPASEGRPTVGWKPYADLEQDRPDDKQLRTWFRGESVRSDRLQLYVVCGRVSNVVVLDCDSEQADRWWRDLLGDDVMDSTARALSGSGRGHHYWFRIVDGRPQKGHSVHDSDTGIEWDLRGDGGGVVMPPSGHKSGGHYSWVRGLEHLQDWAYPEILNKPQAEGGLAPTLGGGTSLAALLATPGEGGRNNWVTRVLGHYAKALRFEDGYRGTAEMVWAMASGIPSSHEYDRAEFDRTVNSIWESEAQKWTEGSPEAGNGYLVSDGRQLFTQCGIKDDVFLGSWSNFTMTAKAVVVNEDNTVSYVVDVHSEIEDLENVTITGEKLGSTENLNRWLASRRLLLRNPKGDKHQNMRACSRLQFYLESQGPRRMRGVPWMGYVDGEPPMYVCEQGVISATGVQPLSDAGVIPDPRKLEGTEAVWNYGFEGTPKIASAVLREVMTFHDEVVTSLFGSIWALAPIKGAIMKAASLFPHLAIIAPSESGKTNGFFDIMLQANGRLNSGATYTPASLRDDLARHRGGFVWIDDPANIDDLGDLLRAAAGEGVHTRKGGANWEQIVRTHLVAPIVISAEGLDMLNERAMADRVIKFEVPNPTGRMSRKGDYPQWDDIVTLMNHAGHVSKYAGHYVQKSWAWLESIGGQDGLRQLLLELRQGSGRTAEKIAVVRAGARCLQFVAQSDGKWNSVDVGGLVVGGGDPIDFVAIVDAWAAGEAAGDNEYSRTGPYFIEVVLPTLLAEKGFVPSFRSAPVEPMFMDINGRVRVNVAGVAQAWSRIATRRTDRARSLQLGSLTALAAEAKMMDLGKSIPVKGKRYQVLPPEHALAVIGKAGYDYDEVLASLKAESDEPEQQALPQ